eukprot:2296709-Rhodomonas_salina.1
MKQELLDGTIAAAAGPACRPLSHSAHGLALSFSRSLVLSLSVKQNCPVDRSSSPLTLTPPLRSPHARASVHAV